MNPFDFSVSLRVSSESISPSEVSATLGLVAKWERRMGEPRMSPDGVLLGGVYDRNSCSFTVPRKGDEDLHETLGRFTDRLMPHGDLFRKIHESGGRSEFFIGWFSPGDTGETLSHDLLEKLGKLFIDLALCVYGEAQPAKPE